MFTATITRDVEAVARRFMKDAVRLTIGGSTSYNRNINQEIIEVRGERDRTNQLLDILQDFKKEKCLIFANTKNIVNEIGRIVKEELRGGTAFIHGDVPQDRREQILSDFRSGRVRVLVATDVASRGLDITDIKLIVNYHFPRDIKTYTHRIGRTARYNKKGTAISFIGREPPQLLYDLVDFMVKCRQKVPEYLMRLSGFSQRRVEELEQSIANIELPEEFNKPIESKKQEQDEY